MKWRWDLVLGLGLALLISQANSTGIAEESPSQRLFAECFLAKQSAEDRYIEGMRKLVQEQGRSQALEKAAATYALLGNFICSPKLPKPTTGSTAKANLLLQTLHSELNAANGVLRRASKSLAEQEAAAGNVQTALSIKRRLDEYFSGKFALSTAIFPSRFTQRMVKVGHPYPRLTALGDRTLPTELNHEARGRLVRIWGSAKRDTVKVGRLTVGHIGKAVVFGNAKNRKGWIKIDQPAKKDATGYFAFLASRTSSYDTVRLATLKLHRPHEWSINYVDGVYHFAVRDGGNIVIEKDFRTVRNLDIGFAATVRRPGNQADFKVWMEHKQEESAEP